MAEIRARNVQEAYVQGVALVRQRGRWEETRNGRALAVPEPVMTTYERPLERFLLDPVRDANPFFHIMESLWMLSGRNDVDSLEPFNRGLKQYSDGGKHYHGAYGYRWLNHFGVDQLTTCIHALRESPADRRIVMAMWDPDVDLGREGLDFPCNTHLYFRVRQEVWNNENVREAGFAVSAADVPKTAGYVSNGTVLETRSVLDMTICCRSNDAVWGAYGANAVHFSVLQEFVASAVGVAMGRMHQLSNNLHIYESVLEKIGEPELPYNGDPVFKLFDRTDYDRPDDPVSAHHLFVPYGQGAKTDVADALSEVEQIFLGEPIKSDGLLVARARSDLAKMRSSYMHFRSKNRGGAMMQAEGIQASDMRRACVQWLERRYADAG